MITYGFVPKSSQKGVLFLRHPVYSFFSFSRTIHPHFKVIEYNGEVCSIFSTIFKMQL